jgi:hypothetical protein
MPAKSRPAAHVARLLNSAGEMGIEDAGMVDLINDYFCGKFERCIMYSMSICTA